MDKSLIGHPIEDLDTPALVLDLDVLQRNIHRMQQLANAAGLQLRPHIKAHKTPEIARLQLSAGAAGITAAKVSEAEVFATAGVEDIFIANQIVGPIKLRRLVALARRVPRLSVAVDSPEVAEALNEAFSAAGLRVEVLIELDNGAGRCGVGPDALLPLAQHIARLPALRLAGIMAYCPQGYTVRGPEKLAEIAAWEAAWLAEQAQRLREAGFNVERISGGSSPTGWHYKPGCGLTEIRPGTYCINDQNQVDLGACSQSDVAAFVLSTVISRRDDRHYIIDAGVKALGLPASPISDGLGFIPGGRGRLYKLNDEHGYLELAPHAPPLKIGDKIPIIPARLCGCVNYHDFFFAARNGIVEDIWPIAARGTIH